VTALVEQWWEATRERRLLVQRCAACGSHQHHPRPFCLACGGDRVAFVEAEGRGVVWSFTEVHRSPSPDLQVPYRVSLVRLAEGPVLLTRITGGQVRCDDPVRLTWLPLQDGRHLPVFEKET
jgi:hypothetical protein